MIIFITVLMVNDIRIQIHGTHVCLRWLASEEWISSKMLVAWIFCFLFTFRFLEHMIFGFWLPANLLNERATNNLLNIYWAHHQLARVCFVCLYAWSFAAAYQMLLSSFLANELEQCEQQSICSWSTERNHTHSDGTNKHAHIS